VDRERDIREYKLIAEYGRECSELVQKYAHLLPWDDIQKSIIYFGSCAFIPISIGKYLKDDKK
jgi:hypothetical protein